MTTLARTQDVPPGTIRAFDAIAIANVGGTFHAIDDTCTHMGCSLANGELDGQIIECACHGSQFDVTTGALLSGPAEEPVRSYPVQVVGDQIEVGT